MGQINLFKKLLVLNSNMENHSTVCNEIIIK